MIVNVDFIRKFRNIAQNIDEERVNVYIREAETLDIEPMIGAELRRKFDNLGEIAVDDNGKPLQDEDGNSIMLGYEGDLPTEEHTLLNGGYYTDASGQLCRIEGVKVALAYLAYARFVRNHDVNVSPYGVVTKYGQESTPVEARTISAVSNDACKIGMEHLDSCVRYWKYISNKSMPAKKKHRFLAIGK